MAKLRRFVVLGTQFGIAARFLDEKSAVFAPFPDRCLLVPFHYPERDVKLN